MYLDYMAKVSKLLEKSLNKPCQHSNQSTTVKDEVRIIYCSDCGKELHAIAKCFFCGVEGEVNQTSFYDRETRQNKLVYECKDVSSCLDRCIDLKQLPDYYKKSEVIV